MSLVIIATVGADDANSFVSDLEMSDYCAGRLQGAVWTGAASQLPALVEATRDLSLLQWRGVRTTATQALSWPRQHVRNPDSPDGDDFPDDIVPQRVKDATCELALQYLLGGIDPAAIDPTTGVIRKKVDVLETEWAQPALRPQGLAVYPRVVAYLAGLVDGVGTGNLQLRRT